MESEPSAAADQDLAALHRDLEGIRQRMSAWTDAAEHLLSTRAAALSAAAERLEAVAHEARQAVASVTPTGNSSATEAAAKAEPSGANGAVDLRGDLDGVWQTMRPYAGKRLETLQRARDTARQGGIDDGQRTAAVEAARQLAGSLGGYGRLEGSAAADRAAAALSAHPVDVDALDSALNDVATSIGVQLPSAPTT